MAAAGAAVFRTTDTWPQTEIIRIKLLITRHVSSIILLCSTDRRNIFGTTKFLFTRRITCIMLFCPNDARNIFVTACKPNFFTFQREHMLAGFWTTQRRGAQGPHCWGCGEETTKIYSPGFFPNQTSENCAGNVKMLLSIKNLISGR